MIDCMMWPSLGAIHYGAGEGDARRAGPAERPGELGFHAGDRHGGWLWGFELQPLGQQLARGHIDRRGLGLAPADVSAKCVHEGYGETQNLRNAEVKKLPPPGAFMAPALEGCLTLRESNIQRHYRPPRG